MSDLPDWAEEWAGVNCGCGAPAVLCPGWGSVQTVCSVSAWSIEKCSEIQAVPLT